MIKREEVIIGGLIFTSVIGRVLLICNSNNNWGCPVYIANDQLSNYSDVSNLGTQFNYPAYLNQIFSYSRTYASLGTIAQI